MSAATCEPPPEHRGEPFHWLLVPERGMKPFPLEWDSLYCTYILNCAHECPRELYKAGWRYVGPAIRPQEGEGSDRPTCSCGRNSGVGCINPDCHMPP